MIGPELDIRFRDTPWIRPCRIGARIPACDSHSIEYSTHALAH